MAETVVVARDRSGREVCPECYGAGEVSSPWLDEAEADVVYPCPLCRPEEFQSADEYFGISDALERNRGRDGLSDKRVARAESSHLQEKSFTERSLAQEFAERKRAAGW